MADTTKDKILRAARVLFVNHGFAGTSMGNIAKLAQVNHSLIFHHFKNKETLWVAVKQSIVAEANLQTNTLPDLNLPFVDFLNALFLRTVGFYRENPDIQRMISWQRLESAGNHPIGITDSSDMQRWIQAFKHYQAQKIIQDHFKAEWIVTLILSIISSAALDPNTFIAEEQALQDYIDFCVKGVSRILTGNG